MKGRTPTRAGRGPIRFRPPYEHDLHVFHNEIVFVRRAAFAYQFKPKPTLTPCAQKSVRANGLTGWTVGRGVAVVTKLGIRVTSRTGSIWLPGRTTLFQYRKL